MSLFGSSSQRCKSLRCSICSSAFALVPGVVQMPMDVVESRSDELKSHKTMEKSLVESARALGVGVVQMPMVGSLSDEKSDVAMEKSMVESALGPGVVQMPLDEEDMMDEVGEKFVVAPGSGAGQYQNLWGVDKVVEKSMVESARACGVGEMPMVESLQSSTFGGSTSGACTLVKSSSSTTRPSGAGGLTSCFEARSSCQA